MLYTTTVLEIFRIRKHQVSPKAAISSRLESSPPSLLVLGAALSAGWCALRLNVAAPSSMGVAAPQGSSMGCTESGITQGTKVEAGENQGGIKVLGHGVMESATREAAFLKIW